MKKLLLLGAFAAFGLVSAQNSEGQSEGFKGKWFVMGQAGFNTTLDGTVNSYSILPAVGTFIAPTVAVGGAVGYAGSSVKNSDVSNGLFVVQPLVRKYWGITDNLYIFGQASVPLGFGKNTDASGTDTKYTAYGIEVAPGLDYFLSSNWSIEAQFGVLGWSGTSVKDGGSTSDFNFGLNSGLLDGVKFGIKYVF